MREEGKKRRREGESEHFSFSLLLFSSSLLLFFSACVPTRPVAKIGLIAPFEGLYRQSGYEALTSMRAAIAESETASLEIMPLALDSRMDPAQARRAMEKLLVDPSVRAVVGPFHPETAHTVADLFSARGDGWFLPFLPAPIDHRDDALTALIVAVAAQTDGDATAPVVLAGWSPGWPDLSAAEWSERLGRPTRLSSVAGDVAPSEIVIWLGNGADGAAYLLQLRSQGIDVPLWLALGGDMSIFYQRTVAGLERLAVRPPLGRVYWAAWLDDGFAAWAADHSPNSPAAYAVYRATQHAIAEITGRPSTPRTPHLYIFQLGEDGQSLPVNLPPTGLE